MIGISNGFARTAARIHGIHGIYGIHGIREIPQDPLFASDGFQEFCGGGETSVDRISRAARDGGR
ncbi:hypothetical protein ACGFYV_06970 [Streptomyces sp. NPDC048297]|uniref:hypothetical protein n=1 Tax=Streptomyces sp. NPDC048297 TaxID=3365531 RepID=UPI00371552E0